MPTSEHDYVLGTHEAEIERLALQHEVWRPRVLEVWRRAGIHEGASVLDVGAGPGYAACDLAAIVGATGEVTAVERSTRFIEALKERCATLGVPNVRSVAADLMADSLPEGPFDFAWCRWVASFVSDPAILARKIAAALRPGGRAIFHEYVDYAAWRLLPHDGPFEEFVALVMKSWREAGGEPDIGRRLPSMLAEVGLTIRETAPVAYCVRPRDPVWRWPAAFLDVNLARMVELGLAEPAWAESVRRAFAEAESDGGVFMLTPTVLEIIAERAR